MYFNRNDSQLRRRTLVLIMTSLLIALWAGYWQQSVSSAAENVLNGSIPPGTIPPGSTPPTDKAKVTVIHAAPFDANVDNTALDICTQDGTVVSGLSGLKYLYNASILVAPATYDWKVADAGSNCASVRVDLAPFTLIAQQEVVLILTGDGTNQAVDALLLVTDGGARTIYLPVVAR